jgi:NodT family efflux transporter outer membrane factor (OMF) lipoprotein
MASARVWPLPLAFRNPMPFVVPLAAALLGACTPLALQHAASVPRVVTPAAWSQSTLTGTPQQLADWWKRFDDAELDRLMAEALIAAPDLKSAQARLRQARAASDLAQANLLPSVGASAGATRSRSGREAGGSDMAQTRYSAGFDASWEVPFFGGLRDAATAATADAAAAAANLDAVRVSLAAEVARNYIDLRAYQERLRIARANVASQEETLQITDWRQQAGLATTLDVEQARANLEQSRASIPSLESGRATAAHHLAVLTGQAPGAMQTRLAEAAPLPTPPDSIAAGIPADTLRQRPDLRAAEQTLRAEIARSAERAADREPSLTLSGSLGWQAFDAAALGGSGSLVRSLAASLVANLFDGGRLRARFAVQDAVREQALVAYEKAILTALEDVENALAAYAAGRERVAARQRAADAARNAAQLARVQYQAGLVDFQKVLDTDRTRLTAEDGLAAAQADVLTATVALYKALGGGWQAEQVKERL